MKEAALLPVRANAGLAVGDRIAIQWGGSACTAKILAATDGRYFVAMDWGGKELMDTEELIHKKFTLLPPIQLSLWRRIIGS